MTPVFCCGFECGIISAASNTTGEHWVNNGTSPSISTSTKRTGERSLRCNPSGSSVYVVNTSFSSQLWVGRFYIFFAALPSADCTLFHTSAAGVKASILYKQSDSSIYAGKEDSAVFTYGATGVAVTTERWYRIDFRFNCSANPWLIDGSVDGVSLGQASHAAAAQTHTNIRLGFLPFAGTADAFFDDFILSNTLADYPIGNGKVLHFSPTSDGTHNVAGANDFERSATGTDITNATTTAFQLIDDVPLKSGVVAEYINLIAPPNATDYVEVVFGPASGITTPVTPPRAVDAIVAYASASAGTNNLRIALNDNGTLDDVLNTTTGPGTTAVYARKHYSDPPSAASTWTLSGNGNFNNVRMRCFTSDAAPDPWWASAMIEAEFAEWPQKITQVKQAVNRSNTY